jgi:hypothetical protein
MKTGDDAAFKPCPAAPLNPSPVDIGPIYSNIDFTHSCLEAQMNPSKVARLDLATHSFRQWIPKSHHAARYYLNLQTPHVTFNQWISGRLYPGILDVSKRTRVPSALVLSPYCRLHTLLPHSTHTKIQHSGFISIKYPGCIFLKGVHKP